MASEDLASDIFGVTEDSKFEEFTFSFRAFQVKHNTAPVFFFL